MKPRTHIKQVRVLHVFFMNSYVLSCYIRVGHYGVAVMHGVYHTYTSRSLSYKNLFPIICSNFPNQTVQTKPCSLPYWTLDGDSQSSLAWKWLLFLVAYAAVIVLCNVTFNVMHFSSVWQLGERLIHVFQNLFSRFLFKLIYDLRQKATGQHILFELLVC